MAYNEVQNILRCFCFSLVSGLAVAAGVFAAGPADGPQHVVKVVGADPKTGRLVRIVIVTGNPADTKNLVPPAAINEAVQRIAAAQQLEPGLVHAVIKVESNYNQFAISQRCPGVNAINARNRQKIRGGELF